MGTMCLLVCNMLEKKMVFVVNHELVRFQPTGAEGLTRTNAVSSAIAQQNPLLIEKYIAFTTGAERGKLPLNAVSSAIAQQNPLLVRKI